MATWAALRTPAWNNATTGHGLTDTESVAINFALRVPDYSAGELVKESVATKARHDIRRFDMLPPLFHNGRRFVSDTELITNGAGNDESSEPESD